jgi:hypothetical protein
MKTVYMVGDCHLSRAIEHWNPEKEKVSFVVWSKSGVKMHGFDAKELYEIERLSTGVETPREVDHKPKPFNIIKDDGILVFWVGYVDARTFLSRYQNAEETVIDFIKDIKKNFPNSEVMFIEPLPQFTEMLLKYEGISPYYTHEQRLEQNRLIVLNLHKYAKEAGYKVVITQKDILEAIGVPELTPSMTHSDAPHPVDGLRPEYMSKVWKLFSDKLTEIVVD